MIKQFSRRVRRLTRAVRRYAHAIWTRITTEAGYADALARVVVAAVTLLAPNRRLARFVAETADAFATLVRTVLHERCQALVHRDEDGMEVELPWA